jgi:hypothetical protein
MKNIGMGRRLAFAIYIWFAVAVTVSVAELMQYLPFWAIGILIWGQFFSIVIIIALSKKLQEFVRGLNMRWITMFHVWRVVPGIAFLALYWIELLPARFALPAGIGDCLIAIAAPWVANRLELANRRVLLAFHILGFLDLAQVLISGLKLAIGGEVRMNLMTHFPLSLLGLFLVPLTLTMHAVALYIIWYHQQDRK